jgi:hypothetical protein
MTTAMQEMLEWTRKTFPMDLDTPRMIEDKIQSLLQKEKQQIKDAVNYGAERFGEIADIYYNQTYNKNK